MVPLTILRQIPNSLTLLRLILILPFLLYLYDKAYESAFYVFVIAGLTDGLDGWLARHFHWQSKLGSMLDPFADKLLVMTSFISLGLIGSLPWWLVVLVILRDISISWGALAWIILIQKKLDFEPTTISKVNTTLQLALITVCLFQLAYYAFPTMLLKALILLTTLTTSVSFIDYVWTWGKKAWQQNHQN